MRHRVSKVKFKNGKDANKMMLRKLTINFLRDGHIVTTEKRAKVLKSHLEKLLEKTKVDTQANATVLLKNVLHVESVTPLFERVGKVIKGTAGGYVKIQKLNQRVSDGALMTRMEWAYPILNEEKKPAEVKPSEEAPKKVETKK